MASMTFLGSPGCPEAASGSKVLHRRPAAHNLKLPYRLIFQPAVMLSAAKHPHLLFGTPCDQHFRVADNPLGTLDERKGLYATNGLSDALDCRLIFVASWVSESRSSATKLGD